MTVLNFFLSPEIHFFDIATLIGRLFIGVCFVVHGLGKLGIVGTGSMKGFEGWLESLGLPLPRLQARLAMIFEIIGGLFMTTGFFMRFGCLMCLSTMLVAALIGHKGGGYLITNQPPGNEYAVNLGALCVVFFLLGPGSYSLDAILWM